MSKQKAYLFRGGDYIRFDIPTDKFDQDVVKISGGWKGFPASWSGVDTAINWGDDKIYMFRGEKYARFSIAADKFDQAPKSISSEWSRFWFPTVDAAVNWGNGKVYFFKDGLYFRYDIHRDSADDFGIPASIHADWGIPKTWTKIDAALNWGNGKVYLFSGDRYVRFDIASDSIDQKEQKISLGWKGFPSTWDHIDAAVIIDEDAEKMGRVLAKAVKTKVVGYAYSIYDDQRLVKSGYGGLRAKASDDGPKDFTDHTEMGIGSITKSLTAMAALKLMSEKGISVDAPISPCLPDGWKIGPGISSITFRELLTHRGGIRGGAETFGALRSMIKKGIKQEDKAKFKYCNANFCLFRILLPIINGVELVGMDQLDAPLLAGSYQLIMQHYVFEPSGIVGAACQLNAKEFAYLYGPPSNGSEGYPYEAHDDSTMIAGAGGWKLSIRELAKVINTFYTTEKILPKGLREKMISEKLGCKHDVGKANHPGGWSDGAGRGYCNSYCIFEDDVQCVLMTNSGGISPSLLIGAAWNGSFGA